jgi:cardiolipin synthase A/B
VYRRIGRHQLWLGHLGVLLAGVLVLAGVAGCSTYRGQAPQAALGQVYAASDPRFMERMGTLLGTTTVQGNRASELINGDRFFPAMIEAIQEARHSVTIEVYIFWDGHTGRLFSEALAERARNGVQVRVLLDWIGSRRVSSRAVRRMREAGADVRFYNRFSILNPGRVNHRDHRKLLVVDGRIGFIGGAGVADFWLGDAQTEKHWRDAFFRIEGPVVAQMQSVFMEHWLKVTGYTEAGDAFFPELVAVGEDAAHVFSQSVGTGSDRVRLAYLLAIDAARKNVRISMAYFIPCRQTREAMIRARRRGVEIEIIVPNDRIDSKLVRPASRRLYGSLLEAGVRIYEYEPSMFHTKAVIVDDAWVSVGSANFDPRTFRYNDEANLNILSAGFARAQIEAFEFDKSQAREVLWEEWKRRSIFRRGMEQLTRPLVPLL